MNRTGPDTLVILDVPLAVPASGLWAETQNLSEPWFNFELTHSYTCNTGAAFSYVMGGLGGYSSLLSLPF